MNKSKAPGYGLISVLIALAFIGCSNPAGSNKQTADTAITVAAVTVTEPARGAAPVTTAAAGGKGYTCGAVSWSPDDNPFKDGTVYTAAVTMTAEKGYTFTGLTTATINARTALAAHNTGKAVTLFYTFTATDTDGPKDTVITVAVVTIMAPVKDNAPVTTAAPGGMGYTCGAVSWSPNDNPFKSGTVYTAAVTLTADKGYTFTGLTAAAVNAQSAVITSNTGNAVTLSSTFAATSTKTVTGITLKTQPANMTYTHGGPLDLTGLVVTLIYDDASAEDVAAPDFTAKNITANPAQGINVVRSIHNGQPVTITYGSLPQLNTGNLTVNKAPGIFVTPAAVNTTYAPGLTLSNVTLPAGYVWNDPSAAINNAGNGQSFAATYTDPNGNHEPATGSITLNVAKATGSFGSPPAIHVTYTPALTLASLSLSNGYAWFTPSTALNAGNNQDFPATYTDSSGNYGAVGVITVNVARAAGATVSAPTAAAIGVNSVTLSAVSAGTGQTVEYARNSTNSAPSTGWQTGATFNGLNAATTYYFFARSESNVNYETGAASSGTAITTKQQAGNIVNYWVDDTGELSVGNGGHGITVLNGDSVTFTANGAGYSNQSWTLNGNVVGSGASYTFDTSDKDKEPGKNYIIGLRVQKNGKYYFTEITVRIIEE